MVTNAAIIAVAKSTFREVWNFGNRKNVVVVESNFEITGVATFKLAAKESTVWLSDLITVEFNENVITKSYRC